MKKYTTVLMLFTICFTIVACKKRNTTFDSLARIEGNWLMQMGTEGAVAESWVKVNDTLYAGKSYEVTKGDSVLTETVNLILRGDDIFYVPVVQNQNNQQPVQFRLTKKERDKFTFENLKHDFPTAIIYEFIGDTALYATISGAINGELRSLDFTYSRTK